MRDMDLLLLRDLPFDALQLCIYEQLPIDIVDEEDATESVELSNRIHRRHLSLTAMIMSPVTLFQLQSEVKMNIPNRLLATWLSVLLGRDHLEMYFRQNVWNLGRL